MKVDETFYVNNCARCLDNAKPDGKHVMCLTPKCSRLDAYLAQAEKDKEEAAAAHSAGS